MAVCAPDTTVDHRAASDGFSKQAVRLELPTEDTHVSEMQPLSLNHSVL